ncbi:hypothetical protein PSEUBRA_004697 [Kalmanozyma brasiliensis GHG001]|uniref:uncharacterized protein n=1 Tax=Kalmanozyma brasiliensis (strain GHG001) TaxID=1365824 RepID=UPI0028683286|nr:uncharacterized protein PSEUBRA_004697 [Kalmanozyma brasiliensis GHG001]KAF6767414.1 hypothetical protein PSEUBRA_004697 [Kalmanozyma brasiliensis GHG001]
MLLWFILACWLPILAISAPVPGRMPISPEELSRLVGSPASHVFEFVTDAVSNTFHDFHPFSRSRTNIAVNSPTTSVSSAADGLKDVLVDVPPDTPRLADVDGGTVSERDFDAAIERIRQAEHARIRAHPVRGPPQRSHSLEVEGGSGVRAPPNTPERGADEYRVVYGYSGRPPVAGNEPDVKFVFPPGVPTRRTG